MTPLDFLSRLIPADGYKIIATLNDSGVGFRHRVCDTHEEAAAAVDDLVNSGKHVFFALSSFKERRVWDKADEKWRTRVGTNAKNVKALWLDLDVGDKAGKYATQEEAAAALRAFGKEVGLPAPMVTSSGGGLHVFWPFTEEVPADQWHALALSFKRLVTAKGLKTDPLRTADRSSVLRVVGTFNVKTQPPRPVVLLRDGNPTPVAVLTATINNALGVAGVAPASIAAVPAHIAAIETGNTEREALPPAKLSQVMRRCNQMANIAINQTTTPEPLWYAGLQVVAHTTKPEEAAALISKNHPEYDAAKTLAKLRQIQVKGIGATSCARLEELNPGGCAGCKYAGKIKSPVQTGHDVETTNAPFVATVVDAETLEQVEVRIPAPPFPYARRASGGIVRKVLKEDIEVVDVVLDYDMFPIRRVFSPVHNTAVSVWMVNLPLTGWKEITVDMGALYDVRSCMTALSNQDVFPSSGMKQEFVNFMVAYIQQLQGKAKVEQVYTKLGWREDWSFVLNGVVMHPGKPKEVVNTGAEMRRSMSGLVSKGDFDSWYRAANFYNRPGYEAHQFAFLIGFAAPLLIATGHAGAIVNLTGETSAGKSTVLRAVNSIWGNPQSLMINGGEHGSTQFGRMRRIATHNNLPVCFDEITNMDPKEAGALTYMISQGVGRLRLNRAGEEKGDIESWCTIMLCSSNTSIYAKLAALKADSRAESARVLEFNVKRPRLTMPDGTQRDVHTKQQADQFAAVLKDNYGFAGERFMEYVVNNRADVFALVQTLTDRIDLATGNHPSNRFWTAVAACAFAAALVARKAKILPWDKPDLDRIFAFVLQYLNTMTKTIMDNTATPEALVSEFLEHNIAHTLIIGKQINGVGDVVILPPRGALYIRHERESNKIYVAVNAFKDYCIKRSMDYNDVRKRLIATGVIISKDAKKVLGAGTEFAKAQTRCWEIDATHSVFTQ